MCFHSRKQGRWDRLYDIFRAEVKKQMHLRGLKYADLATMTGLKRSTISAFMCGVRSSDTTARLLAKALNIEL